MTRSKSGFGIDQEGSTARTEAPALDPPPRPWFDAMAAAARKKLNAPPEWEWFKARVLIPTDDTLVEGAIPKPRKNGGPRKGRGRWAGVEVQTCVVTRTEIDAAMRDYERTTGKCASCAGTGETLAGVSVSRGRWYRPCRRCDGSGRAKDSESASVVLAVDPSRSTPKSPDLSVRSQSRAGGR